MAAAEARLVAVLLREFFGPGVERVGRALLKHGKIPLRGVVQHTQLPLAKVKACLRTLLQHQLLQLINSAPRLEYRLLRQAVIRILRYPRYAVAGRAL